MACVCAGGINRSIPLAASGIAETEVVTSGFHKVDTSETTQPNHSDKEGTMTISTAATKCLSLSWSCSSKRMMLIACQLTGVASA